MISAAMFVIGALFTWLVFTLPTPEETDGDCATVECLDDAGLAHGPPDDDPLHLPR